MTKFIQSLRDRAKLLRKWDSYELGGTVPPPLNYDNTALKLEQAAYDLEKDQVLLESVIREREDYNGKHQAAVIEIERMRDAFLASTTMLEALLVQLESWGHASAVDARGQIFRNEEILARLDRRSAKC